ncbi:MAG: response regulator [Planctomycetota bacterium]
MNARRTSFLLVEDDDIHAHLVMRSLEKSRVSNEIVRVADGAEAMLYLRGEGKFADRQLPDVVLLDLKLPKVDGHQVLSFIKEDERLKLIPVVVMTTSNEESDRAKAYQHHANSYVVKPMDFDKFRQLVTDLCLYWSVWNEPPDGDDQ